MLIKDAIQQNAAIDQRGLGIACDRAIISDMKKLNHVKKNEILRDDEGTDRQTDRQRAQIRITVEKKERKKERKKGLSLKT